MLLLMVFAIGLSSCNKDDKELELTFQKNLSGSSFALGSELFIKIDSNKSCDITLELDGAILAKTENVSSFVFQLPTYSVGEHTLQIFGETADEKKVSHWFFSVVEPKS